MRKIMDIYDIFETKNGRHVLAGTNELFDKMTLKEIKSIVQNRVLIVYDNSKIELNVEDVSISNSLINKKNIYILISGNIKFFGLPKQAALFTLK